MATNIQELKAECTRHGMTLDDLAAVIGINVATLYRKMTGRNEFLRNELQIIRNTLSLDDEQFLLIFFNNKLAKMQGRAS